MMRKSTTLLIATCLSINCLSQINEIGFLVGGVNFIGDVGRTDYIHPTQLGSGLVYKYNVNPRIALRANYSYLPISGDDANSENKVRQLRGINFKNPANEFSVGIEYNFYEYDLLSRKKGSSPYLLVQIAAVDHERPRVLNPDGSYSMTRNTSVSIPFGFGFKTKVFGNIAFAMEIAFRYTFTDELDYSTSQFPSLDFGGTSNDWYVLSGISLIYAFGRPACFGRLR